jgi:hypothetical protein
MPITRRRTAGRRTASASRRMAPSRRRSTTSKRRIRPASEVRGSGTVATGRRKLARVASRVTPQLNREIL